MTSRNTVIFTYIHSEKSASLSLLGEIYDVHGEQRQRWRTRPWLRGPEWTPSCWNQSVARSLVALNVEFQDVERVKDSQLEQIRRRHQESAR